MSVDHARVRRIRLAYRRPRRVVHINLRDREDKIGVGEKSSRYPVEEAGLVLTAALENEIVVPQWFDR